MLKYYEEVKKGLADAATKVMFGNNKLVSELKKVSKGVVDSITTQEIQVTLPEDLSLGDYSTNVAMKEYRAFAKPVNSHTSTDTKPGIIWVGVGESTNDVANKIKEKIKLDFAEVKIAGPGFINFYIKNDILVDSLIHIDSNYGRSDKHKNKLAIVEYSSPNIAKPFGVGHLRSTVIGDSVANLLEAVGYNVMRDNHLGDWGTQFGKVICAIKKWGNIQEIESSTSPVDELVKLYVKFHEESKDNPKLDDEARLWFKKLENGDSEARELWQKCVDWSFVEFDNIYKMLDISFDPSFNGGKGLGESFFESRMSNVIKELEDKDLLKIGENGAKLVFFDDDKYPPLMILKKDATTLYATRDLATDKYRKEKYNPDIVVNEVGNEQGLYFKQLFELEKILGWYKEGQRIHVGHGLFLTGGKKMSTRAGKTVKLEDVLNEAIEKAENLQKEKNKEIAKQVGIGAIKYFDLSHHPATNINFDWDKMLSLEGNSGPYIQYTYARTRSVLGKVKLSQEVDRNVNLEKEELAILRILFKFEEVVLNAAISYSPNLICNYLFELASSYNTFYQKHKIIGSNKEQFRVLLTQKVGIVVKNGLSLLGISAPEKM